MEAMRKSKAFPEVNRIFDDYRERFKAEDAKVVEEKDSGIRPLESEKLDIQEEEVGDE